MSSQGKVAVRDVKTFQVVIMVRGVRRMVPRVRLLKHVPMDITAQAG